uniref:Uncharacterized protein n=1 Tax=Tetraselmis chuii TaxID=63592 RepID=A0A7S1SXL1_9CHLO|mmetsp:Transcript_34584/g.61686  ORF Transcript_34584/g.61686 Transcript_34584/m.61686 type:complete len:601 (+) Transcript_34584:238-2040(+)|eukprot:CAMPEP_0177785726 /NCGR_PEP_ID=MMETSP0491_2-20121128/20510_1 /TAXON_ID=63592 /ORGANISM="Tetraselmis chuii, Strain PLY429" /LENGTH=600 /DNA_ID=CAMNT_0019306823 /DNA_START=894 /DNA_END=2696 /DNA_ORIENTATION=+
MTRRIAALCLLAALALVATPAESQETVTCKVDAFLTCGWLYIPPRYNGEEMFPVGTRLFDSGIGELDAFPDNGLCSNECLDVINGENCVSEKSMLMEACSALQCAVDVKAACGVPEAVAINERVTVNWEEACTDSCVAAMESSVCTGVEEIYPEFRRYKESFGPSGSECSTWQCMSQIADNCEHWVGDYKALPARDMCDIGCYAAMTSDECRLANVEVLLQDGTLASFSRFVDGPSFGPEAPICSEPEPENPWPSVDLIPVRSTPAPVPTNPPCESVSPFNLCLFVNNPKPEEPIPTTPAPSAPAPTTAAPTPAPSPNAPAPNPDNAVRFRSSFGFSEPPEGFPQSFARRMRQLLQTTLIGPRDVTDVVPEEWAQEYKETLANYGSTSGNRLTADDITIEQVNQTFVVGPDGETQTVLIDVDTVMQFADGSSARFFLSSINDALSEIFSDWDLQFAGVTLEGEEPSGEIIDVGEAGVEDVDREIVVEPAEEPSPFPIWAIVLIVVVLLAILGALLFCFLRNRGEEKEEEEIVAANPLNKTLVDAGPVTESKQMVAVDPPAEHSTEMVPVEPAATMAAGTTAELSTEMVAVDTSRDIVERE